jgi:head-tail adaptor
MLTNILKDRVQIQEKTTTQTATGAVEVWKPVQWKYARVVPLDARARAYFQQIHSEVTHKIIFRGSVSLSLGNNRFLHGAKIFKPIEPPQEIEGATVIMVKET